MILLDKWYLDAVTARGGVFMGYSAALRWHGLRFGYESYLYSPPDGRSEERTAIRRRTPPERAHDNVSWRSAALGLDGTWRGVVPRLRRRLLRDRNGTVVWLCHQPRSLARIRLRGERSIEGEGYVERLRMTVPPADLAIDTLHWGRFHADGETMVWITWRHGMAGRWIFRNGATQDRARVVGDAIVDLGFVEESFRAEPQTPILCGLHVYHWFALLALMLGVLATTLPGLPPATPFPELHAWLLPTALAFGLLAGFAMGIDFPGSDRRFSRLAVAHGRVGLIGAGCPRESESSSTSGSRRFPT